MGLAPIPLSHGSEAVLPTQETQQETSIHAPGGHNYKKKKKKQLINKSHLQNHQK